MYIDNALDINNNIVEINIIDSSNIFIKLSNPVFDVHNSYGVAFQPKIINFKDSTYSNETFFIFPMIPQYFHNFFEIFTKLAILKKYNKKFKVILLHVEDKTEGIFNSLYPNDLSSFNSSHLKDFFEYLGLEYICLSINEFLSFNISNVYVFFDDKTYNQDDYIYKYNNKHFYPLHFLKVPVIDTIFNNIIFLQDIFDNHDVIPNKKIYISRKYAVDRKFKHELEIEKFFESRGFEIVNLEKLKLLDQIKTIQESEYIACLYGSALVNASMFANSRVLSINYTDGYFVNVYDEIFRYYNIPHEIVNSDDYDIIINKVEQWMIRK